MNEIKDGIYYENGEPKHAGVVKIDGDLYYAGHNGEIVCGREKTVHSDMTNGLVKHGYYTFNETGKMDKKSYKPIKKNKSSIRNKQSKKKKRKKAERRLIIAVSCVLALAFVVCAFFFIRGNDFGKVKENAATKNDVISFPQYDEPVYLCTSAMKDFYDGNVSLDTVIAAKSGAYQGLIFNYAVQGAESAVLKLNGKEYDLDVQGTSLTIDNLETGRKYDYSADVVINGNTETYTGSFITAQTNRFITLPGVKNTRDIGGYMTSYDKRVREGLLIRGTEIDGLVEPTYYLEDKDAAKEFGFKCDLDLRSDVIFTGDYKSRLGASHKFYNSCMYGGVFAETSHDSLRNIFADLANPDNYPMYLHCTYGADRTGTIVFLLQGILGVAEEDMNIEYELTGFFLSGYEKGTNLNSLYGGLEGTEGDTINEKIVNYLTGTVGVTQEQIESIRNIFLG